MQINSSTGEAYASCESTAKGETVDLMTLEPGRHFVVVCWDDAGDMRWQREYKALPAAVAEYNKWARVPEQVPTFN